MIFLEQEIMSSLVSGFKAIGSEEYGNLCVWLIDLLNEMAVGKSEKS